MDNNQYSKLSREELLLKEKKIKNNEIISAVIVGILLGIMIYGTVNNGFGFVYIVIPIIFILAIGRNSKKNIDKLKLIQREIKKGL